jgi:hypothetical protein
VDRKQNTRDACHELNVLPVPVEARYLRITGINTLPGRFSLYDFRVFGFGADKAPKAVTGLQVTREDDRRRYSLQWDAQDAATGYIVNVRLKGKPAITQSVMVFENHYEGGFFSTEADYEFSVEAFNDNSPK